MRIKINRIDIIDKNDLLKRVEYRYSIGILLEYLR